MSWFTYDADVGEDQVVLRPAAAQRWATVAVAVVVVPLVAVGLAGGITVGSGLVVLLFAVALFVLATVVAWRGQVVMDAQGVSVRTFRTRHLRWEEVAAVEAIEAREWRTGLGRSHPIQPALVARDGDRIHLPFNAGWVDHDGHANEDAAHLRNLVTRSAWRFGGQRVEARARKRRPT